MGLISGFSVVIAMIRWYRSYALHLVSKKMRVPHQMMTLLLLDFKV